MVAIAAIAAVIIKREKEIFIFHCCVQGLFGVVAILMILEE